MSKQAAPSRYDEWVAKRIAYLRKRVLADSKELYELAAPTEQELHDLEDDLQANPRIYTSYLIEQGEGDYLWIALNVLDGRKAQEAMEEPEMDPLRDGPGGVYGKGE